MNSPSLTTLIVAAILAVIAYFVSGYIEITPTVFAIFVFISAFVSPLIGGQAISNNDEESQISTLYVGNLPYRANESAVRALFSDYGNVHSVRLMKDKHTGKRRGFGFVEMSSDDVNDAIAKLNDSEFQQRTLKVREAKDRPEQASENNS
jgi:RNA recognition motif-containing protein